MKVLREYVYEKDITNLELSQKLNCSYTTIMNILKGKEPSQRMKYKINQLLGKDVFNLDT